MEKDKNMVRDRAGLKKGNAWSQMFQQRIWGLGKDRTGWWDWRIK